MASIINAALSGGLTTSADTSGVLQLQTASTTAVTVDASQNVGIGTTSPTTKLHIAENGDTALTIQSITGSGQSPSIRLQRGTYGTDGFNDVRIYNTTGGLYVDSINSANVATNIFTATTTGLGLGTSSPATALDVTKAGGGNFVATFQNTTAATPYCVFIKDAASSANGYPLLAVTDSTGSSTYFRVDSSSGNVGIGTTPNAGASDGVLKISRGITFPATQSASSDANTLDDYEEGTWTPTLTPATSGTITLGSPNLCAYTKIGRVVTVNGLIDTASVSTPVGASVTFNNLPFASNATATQRSAAVARCFSLTSGSLNTTITIVSSVTTFTVHVDASLFQLGSQVYFQLTYTV
jgi:hypothetical protein